MPRQNRVTPSGEIVATPERGTFFGNRGVLHDEHGRIRRAWQLKRWIVCVLQFRGRHRQVMTPGRYTELFFLDEATALTVGHRPCAECRHGRYVDFCEAWKRGLGSPRRPTAGEIDDRLHAERLNAVRSKQTFRAKLYELPDGVFVRHDDRGDDAYLLWRGRLFAWSAGGYVRSRPQPKRAEVEVLTPPSTVAAIRGGYMPEVHESALLR
jgi:hypothetical protein